MTARKAELKHLSRNIEALQTIAGSSVLTNILQLVELDASKRVITIQEFMRLNEAFNKFDNAITELNNLVNEMNGTQTEPEPHGSRDTFVPKPKGPMTQDEWLESMKEKEEIANAFEEYNAMQD
jgi:hypothetical protein